MKRALWWLVLGSSWAACSRAGLSNEQLNAVVRKERASLDECYDAALEKHPNERAMTGQAILEVAPSGEVTSVEIEGDLPLEGLEECLRDAIAGWSFPRSSHSTRSALPLIFEPTVEGAASESP